MKSPRSIQITESDPSSVNRYTLTALRHSDQVNVRSQDYAITGGTTVLPIGSDGFLDPFSSGDVIDLHLIERAGPGSSPDDVDQLVPGSPFTIETTPDGAENITVQL